MGDLPKFINLLIEFGQKLESQINKKYRSFIKSTLNFQQLTKNVKPQSVTLTSEIITFKLGIESKSTKCIQLTLTYLYKFFSLGYIDLNAPNYCQDYLITDSTIEKKKKERYEKQIRNQMVKWLEPLVHFKNYQINALVLKNYQFLIGEEILPSLLEISEQLENQQCFTLLCNYFNSRQFLFQEIYCYTKDQIAHFKHIPTNQKICRQIQSALQRQENFIHLISKYVTELVSKVAGQGGKRGLCVICDQPAEYYCKLTLATLCGLECKKKHLQIAEKQYKDYYHSVYFNKSLNEAITIFSKHLLQKQSPFLFSVMGILLEKPYLHMVVRAEQKAHFHNLLPSVLYKAYESKNQQIIETLYFLIASLAKWWPSECLPQIQYFIKEHILKILNDKKPTFRQLIFVFKSLDKIFQYGRTIVELFTNLDCQFNHVDVISQILFQLSKIVQNKYVNLTYFNKQEKITIKNSCMTLFTTFSSSLNQFRKHYSAPMSITQLLYRRQKKPNLQKFVQKYNEHWSEGLKTLFNLNLVGLESNQEVVNIIMTMSGIDKKMIDAMLFDRICSEYLEIFVSRLRQQDEPLLFKLLSFYKFIPMTENNSVSLLKFVEIFSKIYNNPNLLDTVKKITSILMKVQNYEQFKNKIKQYCNESSDFDYLYLRMLTARKPQTIGIKKREYILCLSQSYLQLLSPQISLLQIPISYLLQTSYDPDKILNLIKQLLSICPACNWLSLLVKHSGLDRLNEQILTSVNIKIIKGLLEIIVLQANFILDWIPVFAFLSNIFHLLLLTPQQNQHKKLQFENKQKLAEELSIELLESTIINSSIKCQQNFPKFIHEMLLIVKQQLKNQQITLLQKYFTVLDVNLQKYITQFDPLYELFHKFITGLDYPRICSENLIYLCDMLKQLLLKTIKTKIEVKDELILSHIKLFKIILQKNQGNKEIGDFIMNCLTTVVVYNCGIKSMTWRETLQIVEEQTYTYQEQTCTIVRKILNDKMKNMENQSINLLKICIKLIKSQDTKYSNQAIHNIKMIIDILTNLITAQHQKYEQTTDEPTLTKSQFATLLAKDIDNLHALLKTSISQLIKIIGEKHNETLVETLLLLFSTKLEFQPNLLLTQDQINTFITLIFQSIEQLDKQNKDIPDRIMNSVLYWSVKNKNKYIVQNLEQSILHKYTNISITAMKCIKTYIQMANLRDEKQWQNVQSTLLTIIKNTQVQRFFALNCNQNLQHQIQLIKQNQLTNSIPNPQTLDINIFIHQCRIQMLAVELLPNHKHCLKTLTQVYAQKIEFNDRVLPRVGIWRKGLGGKNFPPELLMLEEIISNRIMAIHIWENDSKSVLEFGFRTMQRYIDASRKVQILEEALPDIAAQSNNENYQLFQIYADYWHKRRQPLIKLISYLMPKLPKYCKKKTDRKELLLCFVKMMPHLESKDSLLKTFRELTEKEIIE